MAKYTRGARDLIDSTMQQWIDNCLLSDQSLILSDQDTTWSAHNIEDLYQRFNNNLQLGTAAGGRFVTKWEHQLRGASDHVRLLAAEMLLVHFLFASSVTKRGKLNVITQSLNETDITLPTDSLPVRALGQRIGHPGIGFNTRRDVQVGYLIDFVRRFKGQPLDRRKELLSDPWLLRDFADDTDWRVREMRHIILHLLRPDDFERISSGSHKRQIATAFKSLVADGVSDDLDERLLSIRRAVEDYLPTGGSSTIVVDFYENPLRGVWNSAGADDGDGVGDIEALHWKKQIVLYGPPGTSKTWQAENLAETVIRRAALTRWGPKEFFRNTELVETAVRRNVTRLQLHPGFGYDQFIRGLRLEGDVTRYRPGFLPTLVERLAAQQLPDHLEPLPGVLILDEINRTNLSEMLGEAFSLLERDQRGKPVELPGFDAGQAPDVLVIPEDLYVIGTMNEIDQSVETLDFALRRRFLWRECPFERDTLLAIIADRWDRDVQKFSYDDAAEQLERFADRAQTLNEAIENSAELGRQYQIGHAYFADIAFFLGPWVQSRKSRPQKGTYLWTGAGKSQPPLEDLWHRSLLPLLEQYLAGSDVRTDEIRGFERSFLAG